MPRVALILVAFTWFVSELAGASALDKTKMEEYIRHLFVWGPQIKVKIADPKPSAALPGFNEVLVTASAGNASQDNTFYVSADGRRILQGNVYDLTRDPFESDLAKIKTDQQASFGAADAPVTIVMFSDFQCSFCREEAKNVRTGLSSSYPTQVRLVFKDFPLESLHPWAKPAAIAGRCIFRQKPAAFWDFHDWIFEHQGEITPENLNSKVVEFTNGKGVEPVQLNACIENKATAAEVERSIAEGRALGVNSTPTMFINGRRVVGQVPWQNLSGIIDHEIGWQKSHTEKCCEVTLPSPLKQ